MDYASATLGRILNTLYKKDIIVAKWHVAKPAISSEENQMARTATELRQWYRKNFMKLKATDDSKGLTSELWDSWESHGLERPDIDAVVNSIPKREERFFQEVVRHCSVFAKKPAGNVAHCAMELYDFNFRKATASDGCLIITDEAFERLLFVLSMSIFQLVRGDFSSEERNRLSDWVKTVTHKWFLNLEEFPIPREGMEKALAQSYENAEMGAFMYNGMYAFSLAHEIGHHAFGHNRSPTMLMVSLRESIKHLPVDHQSYEEELEADQYALQVYLRLHEIKDGTNPLCFVWWFKFAPLFLFDICEALENAKGTRSISPTHPAPSVRRAKLLEIDALQVHDDLYRDLRAELLKVVLGKRR